MELLNEGLVYEFTIEYKNSRNHFKPGERCNILNNVVVIDRKGRYMFDLNGAIAKKFGRVVFA